MELILFYVLMFFILIAAIVAVETDNLLSSVICVGAIGFGGCILFLFLRAPDIAITQIVVEAIGLVILIRATISRNTTSISGDKEFFQTVVSAALVLLIFLAGIQVFHSLGDFGDAVFARTPQAPSQAYLKDGFGSTGAANIVTSILLDFRAYDTLGEATVLFASIIGATCILRTKSKKGLKETDS